MSYPGWKLFQKYFSTLIFEKHFLNSLTWFKSFLQTLLHKSNFCLYLNIFFLIHQDILIFISVSSSPTLISRFRGELYTTIIYNFLTILVAYFCWIKYESYNTIILPLLLLWITHPTDSVEMSEGFSLVLMLDIYVPIFQKRKLSPFPHKSLYSQNSIMLYLRKVG